MTINARNIVPGKAINQITYMFLGNMRLRKEDKSVHIQSHYLEGEPGVGKSSIAKRIAKALNYYMEDIRANQMSPDDAGGIRMPNMETHTTDWFAPYWLPSPDGKVLDSEGNERLNEEGKPYDGTILFFDELASADDRVRKPLFGVFLDRELNGRQLPDNCLVMAGGNESETGTMVFELDNATRTRFNTMRIVADFTSWMHDYAPGANITPTVVAYLKNNMGQFCMTEEALQAKQDLYGNPRSWEHVSVQERSIMQNPADYTDDAKRDALETMVSGKVGTGIAKQFMATFDIVTKMTALFDIIEAAKKGKDLSQLWPKDISQLYALTYSMMAYPKDVETGKDITMLMDAFPESKNKLPFQEMKPTIIEVMLKRLREHGVPEKEISKNFSKHSAEISDEAMDGPLIKIDL